jgi:hypothetical protein
MKPGLKCLLWGASLSLLAALTVAPKVLPLLHAASPPPTAAGGDSGGKVLAVAIYVVWPSVFCETISATGTLPF